MPSTAPADPGDGTSTSAMPRLPPRKSRGTRGVGNQSTNEPKKTAAADIQRRDASSGAKKPQHPPPSPAAAKSASGKEPSRESASTTQLREGVHRLRVQMMRAALRLGWQEHFVHQVMYRLQLAENLQLPKLRAAHSAQDTLKGALVEAQRLEAAQGAAPEALGLSMTVLLIGFRGAGKSALAAMLLGLPQPPGGPAPTKGVEVKRGLLAGMEVVCIDTPGLDSTAAGTWHNMATLRAIRAAYRRHRPDTVLFVEQLQEVHDAEDQAAVMQSLSNCLGAEVWCNTVVAFTHAADVTAEAEPSSGGPASWQAATKQREHTLQLMIRRVSGDPRLVNPVVWVENSAEAPSSVRSGQGEPVVWGSHAFRLHLRLMLLSAKILADCEALFGLQGSGGAVRGEAGPLPLGYLLSQVLLPAEPTKFRQPQLVAQLRRARAQLAAAGGSSPGRRKQCAREAAEMRRRLCTQQRYQSVITTSSVDRVLQPPATAKHTPLDPPRRHRHVAVLGSDHRGVICSGTVARPQVEAAAAVDHGDSIVGASVEHTRVLRPGAWAVEGLPTEGVPLAVSFRGQCGKEHALVQGRAEASWYHDLEDRHLTCVAAEVQTNGPVDELKALCTLQVDRHLQATSGAWSLAAGCVASGLASPSCTLPRSSTAVGGRLQGRVRTQLARLLPVACSMSAAHLVSWAPTGEAEQGLGASAEVNCTLRTSSTPAGGGVACSASSSVVRVQRGWSSQVQGSAHWKAAGAKWGLTTQVASRRGRLRLRAHAQSTPLLVIIGISPLLVAAVRRLASMLPRK